MRERLSSSEVAADRNGPQADRLRIKQIHLKAERGADDFEADLFDGEGGSPDYLMYSLHACGSLSETMVQLFCDPSSHAKALFNIACCYNLIHEELPGPHFPMSRYVKDLFSTQMIKGEEMCTCTNFTLTRNIKMVACQAPYRWRHRPQQTRNFFKRHFYRALLEKLLQDTVVRRGSIGNINDSALTSFSDYCSAAFRNLDLPLPNKERLDDLLDKFKNQERCLAFMWTMRALLGMPIEALILHDRLHFVREKIANVQVKLVPVLDPLSSPRNMALVAIKNNML